MIFFVIEEYDNLTTFLVFFDVICCSARISLGAQTIAFSYVLIMSDKTTVDSSKGASKRNISEMPSDDEPRE